MNRVPRVAVVHEWFTSMRGGEKCVEALCEVYPEAALYALVHKKGSVSPLLEERGIHTSFIQHLPMAETYYRHYLPLFPTAVERFDLSEFDIVISSNHAVAKGVRLRPETLHICYCYTPMRYIWNLYDDYFNRERAGFMTRAGMRLFVHYLRGWDLKTANNPHYFVAISENVRRRIQDIYHRDSTVIYPPVDTARFQVSERSEDFFLIVSALVPYKRVDLAIDAFNQSGEKLVIIGDGPDMKRLKHRAQWNIQFPGWVTDTELPGFYARCKAVIFPGEEDFGIVPVEAMATGKPVIAYAKGGALETVIDSPDLRTGVLFREQTVDSLLDAMSRFRTAEFIPAQLRAHALRFDREKFKENMRTMVENAWMEFRP